VEEEHPSVTDLTPNLIEGGAQSPTKINNSLRKRDSSQIKKKKENAVRQNLGGKVT
jgi:hypothetical protein